jgi:hypothetical protein
MKLGFSLSGSFNKHIPGLDERAYSIVLPEKR